MTLVNVTEIRTKLPKILSIKDGITLLKNGKPVKMIVDYEQYQSLLKQLEVKDKEKKKIKAVTMTKEDMDFFVKDFVDNAEVQLRKLA